MLKLLLLAALATAPPLPLEACEACRPGKVCAQHRAEEKEELKRLAPLLKSEDPGQRMGALSSAAALRRSRMMRALRSEDTPVASALHEAVQAPERCVRSQSVHTHEPGSGKRRDEERTGSEARRRREPWVSVVCQPTRGVQANCIRKHEERVEKAEPLVNRAKAAHPFLLNQRWLDDREGLAAGVKHGAG